MAVNAVHWRSPRRRQASSHRCSAAAADAALFGLTGADLAEQGEAIGTGRYGLRVGITGWGR
ncbi:hypothetical protein [Streptomyces tanashiensis]|uniref:hypothetical protein n=1 Tax=Streptomyces tanashiensis TaxID=67367 RepID=UPI0033EBC394